MKIRESIGKVRKIKNKHRDTDKEHKKDASKKSEK